MKTMELDDAAIERALATDRSVAPSPHLLTRVMDDVRRDPTYERPLAFPWGRLAWGLGCAGALVALALLASPPAAAPPAPLLVPPFVMQRLAEMLAGSVVVFWWAHRVAGGA